MNTTKDYRAAQSELGEWIIYCPDDSVYPLGRFGTNQAAAEATANALNFPRQFEMMKVPVQFHRNEETGEYEQVTEETG